MRRRRSFTSVVVAAFLVAGCSGAPSTDTSPAPTLERTAVEEGPSPTAAPSPTATVDPHTSLVATANVDEVEVFTEPGETDAPSHVLEHPAPIGAPRVFLVDERQDDWLQVLLPVRPNGSTGWIRASDVDLSRTSYRMHVDLADFELRVHDGDELVVETPIGYGADDTPTPGGRYYVTELLQPPDPSGVYGPYAFGLSGFSDVHLDFAGGEGVIGIHGTNDPDSIGSKVSNGCIRVPNDVIEDLASRLPLGTPVTISA